MRIVPLADVKARLSAYVDQAQSEGPIVITRNGKAVAVLVVPLDDEDLEDLLLARSPRFRTLLARSRQSIAEGRGIPETEFWQFAERRSSYQASGAEPDKGA